jgi:AmmeMemoRadiSam system protein B/AmmeMemoRadiSam system protein A
MTLPRLGGILLTISVFLQAGHLAWSDKEPRTYVPERPPVVAGSFYSNSSAALLKEVTDLFRSAEGEVVTGEVRGLISPHAGYAYSGGVAAAGYAHLDGNVHRVILIGPSHHAYLEKPSIPAVRAYRTPLGSVPLDELAQTLERSALFETTPGAHGREHSLEVQLPFLQVRLGVFSIVPILIHHSNPAALAAALASHLNGTTVVVASSDLSHYHPYERALSMDHNCIEAILDMDLEKTAGCEACGKGAILTLMHLARLKGWTPHLISYKNSGDTGGGKDRVVGYTSIVFTDGKERQTGMERNDLPREDKLGLLKLARWAISAELIEGTEVVRPDMRSSALLEKRGCFVTLHKRGQLRGCIGCIEPVSSLVTCVEEHARSAAFRDPRFPPVTVEELEDIDIEISVLTVPRDLTFQDGKELKEQLEPDVHGVILSRGFRKSTFLPQVWKQLPDKEEFLRHLCVKGGMSGDAWKDPETNVQVYRAEVFGEKDT